jgi:hypothetical protein
VYDLCIYYMYVYMCVYICIYAHTHTHTHLYMHAYTHTHTHTHTHTQYTYTYARALSHTQVVKQLWAYIKANDLQNPSKKTEIIPDDKMKKVFGPARFTVMRLIH